MFSATMSSAFTDSMAIFAGKMLTDAIERLANKYGFDKEEAQEFLLSGGVHVKLPPLEKSKLPWCGVVDESCCRAIQKNGGLFTQCTNSPLDGGWCKKCAKDVEKNGTPTNGDVEARLAKGVMDYKVGNTEVKPYIVYMEKNGITQEQATTSASEYGYTIDPRQFEKKKRGRKNTTARVMEAPSTPLPAAEPEEAEEGELAEEPVETVDLAALHRERVARETAAKEAKAAAAKEAKAAAKEAAKETKEAAKEAKDGWHTDGWDTVPDDKITLAQIKSMKKDEVHAACTKYGIDIGDKNLFDLKKELKTKVV
jgi:hypothetical protein